MYKKIGDLLESSDFSSLKRPEYRPIIFGYTTRGTSETTESLVGERVKVGDSLRQGQLIIPAGGLKKSESVDVGLGAIRETREESVAWIVSKGISSLVIRIELHTKTKIPVRIKDKSSSILRRLSGLYTVV